jgi:hypothetical protein
MALAGNLAHYLGHVPDFQHSKFFNPSRKEYHCPTSATTSYCFQEFGTIVVGVEGAETEFNGIHTRQYAYFGRDGCSGTNRTLMEDDTLENIKFY